jgi:hypothetical protein
VSVLPNQIFYNFEIGSLSYYALSMHAQPDVAKRACMIVQLGYEPTGASRRAQAFDCIAFTAQSLHEVEFEGDQLQAARDDILQAVNEKGAVLVIFVAKRVVYTEEENEEGVKFKKQNFVGEGCILLSSVLGVVEREGPLFHPQRGDFLFKEIIKKIRS